MPRRARRSVLNDTKLSVISHQPIRHPEFYKANRRSIEPCEPVCKAISGSIDKQMLKQYKMSQRGTSCANLYAPAVQHDRWRKSRVAFTLAEVLITLTIVGVIAALTIPSLIVKHEKEETTARLKKVYSTLSQATQRSIADNGPLNTWGQFNFGRAGAKKFSEEYLMPYLKVMKNCQFNRSGDCYYECSRLNDKTQKIGFNDSDYHFYLNDGTLISVYSAVSEVSIFIDINGKKGPNIWGKDAFFFRYKLNSNENLYSNIFPQGLAPGTKVEQLQTRGYYACNKNAAGDAGKLCAAKIMLDGWKIKDDYPW